MEGWFAILDGSDHNDSAAYLRVVKINYNGTPQQAVNNLYGDSEFSGPWKTKNEAETAVNDLLAYADNIWGLDIIKL